MNIWPYLTRSEDAPLPDDTAALKQAAGLFAELMSPVLAEHLLAPVSRRMGMSLVDRDAVERDRRIKRFALAQQRRWAQCLVEGGIETVFIKGFANAHTLYPDPVLRAQGDLDILVRAADFSRTVAFLSSYGFRFRAASVNPWGMISDASFMPFVSPDGGCLIDIHVHPDCYPAHRSLTTERVFASSRTVTLAGFDVRVPSPEHALILCATNAAKDKYFLSSLTKVIDAIVLLRSGTASLDWDRIAGLAKEGGFYRPLTVFLCLLGDLQTPMADVPAGLRMPPTGLRGTAYRNVVDDFRALFPYDLPLTTLLWRELLIGAELRVSLHNIGLRLRGLISPSTGIPDGGPVEDRDLPPSRRSHART